jgi:hypothetical protein
MLPGWVEKTIVFSSGSWGVPPRSGVAEALWLFEWSDFGFPARLEGEYRHSMPQARHLEQIGRAFEHFTLARKHPSQDARSRGWRIFVVLAMAHLSIVSKRLRYCKLCRECGQLAMR